MLKMNMACRSILLAFESLCRSLDSGSFPDIPKARDDFDDLAVKETINSHPREWDPQAFHEGQHYVDWCAVEAISSVSDLQDVISRTLFNRTKANPSVEQRNKPMTDNIRNRTLIRRYPPAPIDPDLYHEVIKETAEECRLSDLRSYAYEDCKIVNGLAGWGFHGKKHDGNNMRIGIKKANGFEEYIKAFGFDVLTSPPHIALTRCQLADITDPKVRLVWCCCLFIIQLAARIWQPIYNKWKKNDDIPMLFGYTLHEMNHKIMNIMEWSDDETSDYALDAPCFDCGGFKTYEDEKGERIEEFFEGFAFWEHIALTHMLCIAYETQFRREGLAGIGLTIICELYSRLYKRLSAGRIMYHVKGLMASGDMATFGGDSLSLMNRNKFWTRLTKLTIVKSLTGGDNSFLRLLQSITDWEKQVKIPMKELFGTYYAFSKSEEFVMDNPFFYGRKHYHGYWFREFDRALELCILRERSSLGDMTTNMSQEVLKRHRGISVFRLYSLFYDTGGCHIWILAAAQYLEKTYNVKPIPDDEGSSFLLEMIPEVQRYTI